MTYADKLQGLPSLLVLLSSIFFFGFVWGQHRRNQLNNAFLMVSAIMSVMALGDFLLRTQQEIISRHAILQITTAFFFLSGLSYLYFVYALSKKRHDVLFYAFLCIGVVLSLLPLLNVFMHQVSPLAVKSLETPTPNRLLIAIFAIYVIPQVLYIMYLTVHSMLREKDDIDKKRLMTWLCGLIVATCYLAFVDFVLPIVFHNKNLTSFGIFTAAISQLFAWWAVIRYNSLTVTLSQVEIIFSKTFSNVVDALLLLDRKDKIVFANNGATQLFGLDATTIRSLSLPAILPDYSSERSFSSIESTLRIKNRECPVLIDKTVLPTADETVYSMLIVRDISRMKRAEEAQLRNQKLESLGILAGGIAHDFNNYLCGIASCFGLARMGECSESDRNEILLEGERTALNARSLSQQLLTFAKGGAPIFKKVDIKTSLCEACTFASRGNRTKIEFNLPEQNIWINVDEGQIRQVFQNVVLNACQASPVDGLVHIHGAIKEVAANGFAGVAQGPYFQIKVTDYGGGISPEVLPRIFDPYFSTKKEGSGLGLAISNSIVKNHNGHIAVSSSIGKGTEVIIDLPMISSEEVPLVDQVRTNAQIKGHGRVLILDDVRVIRITLAMLLKEMGYIVDSCETGEEALSVFNENRHKGCAYRFVITDLVVPGGMGGKELAEKIKDVAPTMPIIISSGYSANAEITRYRDYGFAAFLQKPYSREDLKKVVEAVDQGTIERLCGASV